MTLPGTQEPHPRESVHEMPVAGGTQLVRERGRGRAVVLVHGISADHTEWNPVADLLVSRFRVLQVDLLGRGGSRAVGRPGFTLTEEAARLDVVLGGLGVRNPLVAGHSHGASIALVLARRRALGGLLLVSPVTPWTGRPGVLELLRYGPVRRAAAPLLRACRRPLTRYILTRRVYGRDGPDVEDAVRRYAAPYADPERARALLRALRDWRPAELAAHSPPPGLPLGVVTGAADRRIRPADARRWARRLGAPCTVLAGAAHGLPEERPHRIAAMLAAMADVRSTEGANRSERDR